MSLPGIELDYRPSLTDKGKFVILQFEAEDYYKPPMALVATGGDDPLDFAGMIDYT